MTTPTEPREPTLDEIRRARRRLGDRILETPVWRWRGRRLEARVGAGTEVYLKLELFQHTGTFKPRGALLNVLALDPAAGARGVTAVSAGNHAMAVAFAARALGTTAKVVMPRSANPARVEGCRSYGAEVLLVEDVHRAFAEARRIEEEEGRAFIHPFEGLQTILGTATVGLELAAAIPDLDAVIVPIGGGGLCAGVAAAVKQSQPRCRVVGVEPVGADTMHRSFAAGRPMAIERVDTVADSLGAPHAGPWSYGLCRRYVDELVRVDDAALIDAMRLMLEDAKLAVEPAGAAATAALVGPLAESLRGRRVANVVCGSNIDAATFAGLIGATTGSGGS